MIRWIAPIEKAPEAGFRGQLASPKEVVIEAAKWNDIAVQQNLEA